jgi:hypothetical protein
MPVFLPVVIGVGLILAAFVAIIGGAVKANNEDHLEERHKRLIRAESYTGGLGQSI